MRLVLVFVDLSKVPILLSFIHNLIDIDLLGHR
jgi:hypothetical protein